MYIVFTSIAIKSINCCSDTKCWVCTVPSRLMNTMNLLLKYNWHDLGIRNNRRSSNTQILSDQSQLMFGYFDWLRVFVRLSIFTSVRSSFHCFLSKITNDDAWLENCYKTVNRRMMDSLLKYLIQYIQPLNELSCINYQR